MAAASKAPAGGGKRGGGRVGEVVGLMSADVQNVLTAVAFGRRASLRETPSDGARRRVSAEYPRGTRGVAAIHFHGISTRHERRRRDAPRPRRRRVAGTSTGSGALYYNSPSRSGRSSGSSAPPRRRR